MTDLLIKNVLTDPAFKEAFLKRRLNWRPLRDDNDNDEGNS